MVWHINADCNSLPKSIILISATAKLHVKMLECCTFSCKADGPVTFHKKLQSGWADGSVTTCDSVTKTDGFAAPGLEKTGGYNWLEMSQVDGGLETCDSQQKAVRKRPLWYVTIRFAQKPTVFSFWPFMVLYLLYVDYAGREKVQIKLNLAWYNTEERSLYLLVYKLQYTNV